MINPTKPAILALEGGDSERLAPPDLRVSLMRVFRMIWRWRLRSLLIVATAFLLGLIFVLLSTERYAAHAMLIVGIRQPELLTAEQARDIGRAEPDIDGAIELMKSQPAMSFVEATLAKAGFSESRKTSPPLLTQLRAVTDKLLGRTTRAQTPLEGDPVRQRIAELRQNFKFDRINRSTLVDVAFTSANPTLAAAAANAMVAFSAQEQGALSRMSLQQQSGFSIVRTFVVSPAVAPDEPSSPNGPVILSISILIGLGAAITASLFADFRLQQTVLSAQELARRGVRALALLPTLSAKEGPGAFQNAVASLQAALFALPRRNDKHGVVFLLTSALPGVGKSTTAVALARSIAASGRKVLLVDADLRSPMIYRRLGLNSAPGLSACVGAGHHQLDAVQEDSDTGLHVLTAGDGLDQPFTILASPCLRDLFEEWRTSYQVIVVDAPPVLTFGDTRLLALLADHAVVIARWGETTWDSLTQTLQVISESGGRVAGVAISRVNLRKLSRFDFAESRIDARALSKARARRT